MPPTKAKAAAAAADPSIITINVGGQLFQTTRQTLSLAGPNSLLSSLPANPFFDRDPRLFSSLLSLLRHGHLLRSEDLPLITELLAEARYYNFDPQLLSSISIPSHFDSLGLSPSFRLPLRGRDFVSAVSISSTSCGSILVAHGGKLTSFDPSLTLRSTILTPLLAIDSLLSLAPSLAAIGATDFPNLRVLDVDTGSTKKTLDWVNHPPSGGPDSTVQAIGSSPNFLFGSFESGRRNANVILSFDLESFRPVMEIARREIYGAELDSAIPATKLNWVPSFGVLMAAGSHGGPSGLIGNVRLWDVRSGGAAVWEIMEKVDCFADVTVCDELPAIFKVGVNSGEVFMMDMRKLSTDSNSWVCLGDGRKAMMTGRKEGSGSQIESYGRQVFRTRGGEVEVWMEVAVSSAEGEERVMRRNLLGREKDLGGSKITQMAFGGSRMVLARKDQHYVEVWESSVKG